MVGATVGAAVGAPYGCGVACATGDDGVAVLFQMTKLPAATIARTTSTNAASRTDDDRCGGTVG